MNELLRLVHGNKTKKYKSVKKLIRNYSEKVKLIVYVQCMVGHVFASKRKIIIIIKYSILVVSYLI